eukprot:scaffold169834_cov34-Cyclotella_meneghiniana.AAC.1
MMNTIIMSLLILPTRPKHIRWRQRQWRQVEGESGRGVRMAESRRPGNTFYVDAARETVGKPSRSSSST